MRRFMESTMEAREYVIGMWIELSEEEQRLTPDEGNFHTVKRRRRGGF
jgi:hypothetical protein